MKKNIIKILTLGSLIGCCFYGGFVSATSNITYQTTVNPEFVINDSISVALSSADLVISDLVPGQSADSNIITVTVSSNAPNGYSLGSTVGDSETYDTDTLVHTNGSVSDTFANMTAAGSLTAGKWGYSYSSDSGTTWSTYNGLPLYTSEPVEIANSSSAGTTSTQFKIGAYATTQQIAGEYNNIVNFIATAEAAPTTLYMQTVTTSDLASLMPNVGDTTTLSDARDDQEYTIAKLADNKYWMVENLNLAGGTTLNAGDSNVPSNNYYTLPTSTAISSGTSVPSDQFSDNSTAYVFNTGNNTTTCNSSTPCNSYYSWLAATAGGKDSSGNAVTTNGYNAAYSICPKGWRLPTSTTSNASAQTSPNSNWKTGDWYTLMTAYGANLESNYNNNSDTNFYTNAGPGTIPNFLLAGYYKSGSFVTGGSYGYYWSATSGSSTNGYYSDFNSSGVSSASGSNRRFGFSVRCLFAE